MITTVYKDYFIHENLLNGTVEMQSPNYAFYKVKSVLAAKMRITRMINKSK